MSGGYWWIVAGSIRNDQLLWCGVCPCFCLSIVSRSQCIFQFRHCYSSLVQRGQVHGRGLMHCLHLHGRDCTGWFIFQMPCNTFALDSYFFFDSNVVVCTQHCFLIQRFSWKDLFALIFVGGSAVVVLVGGATGGGDQ